MIALRSRGFCKLVCLAFVICYAIMSNCTAAEVSPNNSCSHFWGEKKDMDYRIDVSINVVEPLDNVAYVAILFSYFQPVNYEVKCFRLYYTEENWYEIPFQQEFQKEPQAPSVFASLIPFSEELLSGVLIPVISNSTEMEEMPSAAISLNDLYKNVGVD